MRPRFASAVLVVLAAGVLSLGLTSGTARAEDPAAVRRALERALADGGFQTGLPREGEPPAAEAEPDGRRERTGGRATGRRPSGGVAPSVAGGLSHVFAWLLMGGAVLAILWFVLRSAFDARARRRSAAAGVVLATPDAPALRGPLPTLDEAVALAQSGAFDEGAHCLLLGALGRVLGRLPDDALTSREILDAASLPTARQRALGHLVGAVEASLFGGRPLGRREFDGCVASYRTLVDGEGPRDAS